MPPSSKVVAIIGAGLLGSSTAFHLANMLRRSKSISEVLVFDKNVPGECATSQSAGLVVHVSNCLHKTAFVCQTIRQDLRALGLENDFVQTGTIRVAVSEESKRKLLLETEIARAANVSCGLLDAREAKELVPWLRVDADATLCHVVDDGWIDPQVLCGAYLRSAREMGVSVRYGEEYQVSDVLSESTARGRRVVGVRLASNEVVSADAVIDATGTWGGLVSRPKQGLPMAPTRSHYWTIDSTSVDSFPAKHPNVILPDGGGFYTRSSAVPGTFVLGLQESAATSRTWDARRVPVDGRTQADMASTDAGQAQGLLLDRFEELASFMPDIETAELRHYTAGMSTYTIDGKYLVGAHSALEGLFTLTGCNGSGLSVSGGIGKFLAAHVDSMLATESTGADGWSKRLAEARANDPRISMFDPERIDGRLHDRFSFFDSAFRTDCARSRTKKFQYQGGDSGVDAT